MTTEPTFAELKKMFPNILFGRDRKVAWQAQQKGIDLGKESSGVPLVTKYKFKNQDPLK